MGQRRFELVRDAVALRALAPSWECLWRASVPRPPMLEQGWIETWWGLQRRQGRLFVVLARQDGRLIGLAPLYVRSRGRSLARSLRTVMFLGTGEPEPEEVCGENNGWLCGPEDTPAVTQAVAQALLQHRAAWDRIELRHIGPDTSLAEQLRRALQPALSQHELRRFASRRVRVATLPQYIDSTGSRTRRARFRKLLRHAHEMGLRLVRAESSQQALDMFEHLVLLHQRHWRACGKPGACSSQVFREFHRQLIARQAASGRLWLFGLQMPDGRWLGLHYDLEAGDTLYYYLSGVDYEVGAKLSPGKLLLLHAIDMAATAGLRWLDLMVGDADFKRELATDSIDTVTLEGISHGAVPRAWETLRQMKRRLLSAPGGELARGGRLALIAREGADR